MCIVFIQRYVFRKLRIARIDLRVRTPRHLTLALNFESFFRLKKGKFVAWRNATIFASLVMSTSADFSFYETKQMTFGSYARNFSRNVCRRFNRRGFRVSIHGMVIDASGISHPESWERRVSRARRTHVARTHVRTIFVASTMSTLSTRREKKNNNRTSR